MSKWIKKDDHVYVTAGNDKGKTGQVLQRKDSFVVVQGLNVRKKHIKRTQKNQSSQILSVEMPIHISNVALCDKEGKKMKLKVKRKKDKSVDLVYKESGKDTVYRSIKKKRK
jgi:large subunit ribosomal protein L24